MFTSSPLQRVNGIQSENDKLGRIMLEKNGITLNFPPGVVSSDQITAIQVPFYWLSPILCCLRIGIFILAYGTVQEAYWSIASALSEADGIDYTDPEEVHIPMYFCSLFGSVINFWLWMVNK